MTKKQKILLDWLRQWFRCHEYSPSYGEIIAALGLSTRSNACRYIKVLEREGYVTRQPGTARTLALTAKGRGEASLTDAARALIEDGIISEDETTGRAVVDMDRLGALELAWRGDGPLKMLAVAAE